MGLSPGRQQLVFWYNLKFNRFVKKSFTVLVTNHPSDNENNYKLEKLPLCLFEAK